MNLLGRSWTIYVCPWEDCGRVSSVQKDCRSALHGIPKPMVEVEVEPKQPRGAVATIETLRLVVADLIEGEEAEEGTPKWYALRNARAALDYTGGQSGD